MGWAWRGRGEELGWGWAWRGRGEELWVGWAWRGPRGGVRLSLWLQQESCSWTNADRKAGWGIPESNHR